MEDDQDLEQSVDAWWFTRGWTVQEVIEPKFSTY